MPNTQRPTVVFRPTVIIGLGGTGYGVILKLKRRFIETYGFLPPVIQLLSIDTTENAQRREQSLEGVAVSLEPNEMYQISITNPGQVVRRNPHIQEWWPSEVNANLPIDKGAGQVRARGRLSLFARSGDVSDRIHQAIGRVRDIKNNKQADADNLQVSNTGGVEVYIVGSIAGGTGSGMFLDTAFMTRNRDPFLNIIGIFALPGVFMGKPFTDLVQSNAYGALKEIEAFWHPDPFSLDYGTHKVEVTRSPFDLLYLVDSVNEIGRVVSDPNDLQSLIADGIYVQIGSQIGVDSANATDNIKSMLSEKLVKKRRVSYCSFGFAALTLPVREYEKMQLEDAQQLLQENLLSTTQRDIEADVNSFIERQKLANSKILDRLSEKEQGGRIYRPMSIAGMKFDRNAQSTITELHTRYASTVEQQITQQLAYNASRLQNHLLESLENEWETALNRKNGLDYVTKFLQGLQAKLDAFGENVQKQAQDAQQQLKNISFESREARVAEAANSINPFGKESKIEAACQNYVGLVNQQIQLYLQNKRCDRAFELYTTLRTKIEELLQRQERIISSLSKSLTEIEQSLRLVETKNKSDNPFEHTIERFDAQANRPPVTHEDFVRWRRENGRSLRDYAEMRAIEVEAEIREFVKECYRPLTEMSVDEVLRSSDPEVVNQDLQQLWNLAYPLWRHDDSKIPLEDRSSISESCYYGTPDANRTALKDPVLSAKLPKGTTSPSFVSTADPHRITLFRVKVGVPLFALHGIEDMEHAYKSPGKAFKHLHKDWVRLPNLIPSEDDGGALRWFALGLERKIIIKKGGYYSIEASSLGLESDEDIQLGKKRVEAFEEFKHKKNKELVEQVANAVEREFSGIRDAEDDTKIMAILGRYIQDLGQKLASSQQIDLEVQQQVEAEIEAIEDYILEIDPHRLD